MTGARQVLRRRAHEWVNDRYTIVVLPGVQIFAIKGVTTHLFWLQPLAGIWAKPSPDAVQHMIESGRLLTSER
jgi:hypothetical protein